MNRAAGGQNPAIVVVGCNRPGPLRRLLTSVLGADYSGKSDVPLIISLDNCGDERPAAVAQDFEWPYGSKEIRRHKERLGLRRHILTCGDIAFEHDGVIILEDDMFVAPGYYHYAAAASDFYRNDDRIAGVSLYNIRLNETVSRPFEPLDDGFDVYFLQLPSSLGQVWTAGQWRCFRKWYHREDWRRGWTGVPNNVQAWPQSSWKKYFACYMVQSDRYFVYPRGSLATNFGDPGTHLQVATSLLQVPLTIQSEGQRFVDFGTSLAVYDPYMELLPSSFHRLNPELAGLDLAIDLYGSKPAEILEQSSYILTVRGAPTWLTRYERSLRPHEMGVLLNCPGVDISLVDGQHLSVLGPTHGRGLDTEYDAPLVTMRDAIGITGAKLRSALRRRVRRLWKRGLQSPAPR